MAQHPHVPRFGNWERENITYTAYFETARKGRGAGGRILNPNDPEEIRPELINRDEQHRVVVPPGNNGKSSHGSSTVRPPSTANTATSNRNVHVTQQSSHHQEKKRRSKEADAASVGHTRSVPDHGDHAHHKGSANAQRSRKGFGSDDSCSSASLIHSHQSQSRSKDAIEQKRHDVPYHGDHAHHKGSANAQRSRKGFGSDESCSSASLIHSHQSQSRSKDAVEQKRHHDVLPPMSPQQQPMSRTKKDRQEDAHHRAASVPKFGAWDVSSPQPGAGFTMIFDKVKEERQNAASKLPPAVLINNHGTYSPHQGISDGKPIKPKMFCCFLPMVG